jgi:hypothetical protein
VIEPVPVIFCSPLHSIFHVVVLPEVLTSFCSQRWRRSSSLCGAGHLDAHGFHLLAFGGGHGRHRRHAAAAHLRGDFPQAGFHGVGCGCKAGACGDKNIGEYAHVEAPWCDDELKSNPA